MTCHIVINVHNYIYTYIPLWFSQQTLRFLALLPGQEKTALRDWPSYTIISILDSGNWELSLGKVEEWRKPTVKSQVSTLGEKGSHSGIPSPQHCSSADFLQKQEIVGVGFMSVLGRAVTRAESGSCLLAVCPEALSLFSLSPMELLKRWFSFFWVMP